MRQEPFQAPSEAIANLQRILELVTRPIEFASRGSSAHLATMKNLGAFVSNQVVQALAEHVYPSEVEANLLTLRQLFSDQKPDQSLNEHQHQVARAREILARLDETLKHLSKKGQESFPHSPSGDKNTIDFPSDDHRIRGVSHSNEDSVRGPHEPAKKGEKAVLIQATHADQVDLWSLPIRFAKGVGPKRAQFLEKLRVMTVEDAFWFLPWRYEDRSAITAIGELRPGTQATISGTIQSSQLRRTRRRQFTILTVAVQDETGILEAVFFNQPYLEKALKPDTHVLMSGAVSVGRQGWTHLQMQGPQYDILDDEDEQLLHVGRIVPIYHETRGLTSRQIRRILKGLLDQYLSRLEETFPQTMRDIHHLLSLVEAVGQAHFPNHDADLEALNTWTTSAHRRLAFEECFLLQLALAVRQRKTKEEVPGIEFQGTNPLIIQLREQFPFQLTQAQERVIEEIRYDMASPRPMNRLVQGDVGSGKTVVALHAMLTACGSGYQAALMAPTEILAEQHYLTMQSLLDAIGVQMVLVKGGASQKERAEVLQRIKSGEAKVIIGTHALIQQEVQFVQLGLVVVDEQHKFGVLQRATLRSKGQHPDFLVMTATPIPRTLAMTAYGDLDVSVIESLPPGRKPVHTLLFRQSERKRAYKLLHDQVHQGRQAYVVYPLVEESEKVDLETAIQGAERLQAEEFPSMRVGLLHGRMKSEDKARTMAAFKKGEIQILVGTTVIEVGLDVPNATVMLIEHAERFGLAQLHQLRGRVGRGQHQSTCLLVHAAVRRSKSAGREGEKAKGKGQKAIQEWLGGYPESDWLEGSTSDRSVTQSAQQRLQAMVVCADGFAIAEQDLRIRGPGEFLGVRQWGLPEFRVADLIRDGELFEQARKEAFELLEKDPHLTRPEHQTLTAAMLRRWQAKFDLGSVG